ncbi:hypothetical protein [Streptomyces prasinopilosus]|uniref:LigA protein n=1 Tax=Streptomyces prasinopilosus TaxID=67344 RepID=A0A1G6NMX7_9ACTN|nr:hypothetical protein [Streptomyces prasinopilosus]SDC69253.1 hypothetical protein SAMN05216505_103183 [Streptomyces prasinopilosus]
MSLDQHSDPFEERLSAALHDTGDTFEADRRALADGGLTRGRRIRARRRAAVLGGAAGIALVGVGGALLLPGGSGSGGGEDGRTSAASGAEVTAGAKGTPAPVSGEELIRTLKELLPDGRFSGEQGRGTDSPLGPFARVVYDDGEGPAAVGVGLQRVEPGSSRAREATLCPDKVLTPHDSCATSTLADGSKLMMFKGYEYPDRRAATRMWNAVLVTPQGQLVGVGEWNSAAEKDEPVSRPAPPLSASQLKELATALQWRTVVDAIPEPVDSSAPPPRADGPAVRERLAGLVPDRLDVVSKGGQEDEYAYLVVDDGEGRSFVQVNVQHGMAHLAHELPGPAEKLEDGTRVVTRRGPGEKGAAGVVMWTVDTLRTDGMRVVVSAFNSGAQHEDATREVPALTMEELRTIALSRWWDDLK